MPSKFMSTTIALVLIIPLIGVWFMAMPPEPVSATSCGSLESEIEEVEMIFLGKALGYRVEPRLDWQGRLTLFDVETVWKGPLDQTVRLYSSGQGSGFELGKEYLVFAYEHEGALWTGFCSSAAVVEGKEDKKYWYYWLEFWGLGEGESPPPSLKGRVLNVVFALSVSGLVGMAWLGWRTRRAG